MGDLKTAEPASKQALILSAARDAFLDDGYEAISMDEIARRAGVAKQTVYSYYPSKDRLFLAVVKAERQRLGWELPSPPMATPAAARTGLMKIGLSLLEFILNPSTRSLIKATVAAARRFPSLGTSVYEATSQRTQTQLTGVIQGAVDAGALQTDDAQTAGEQFVALVRGQLFLHSLLDPTFEATRSAMKRQVEEAVDCFLAKYGAVGQR